MLWSSHLVWTENAKADLRNAWYLLSKDHWHHDGERSCMVWTSKSYSGTQSWENWRRWESWKSKLNPLQTWFKSWPGKRLVLIISIWPGRSWSEHACLWCLKEQVHCDRSGRSSGIALLHDKTCRSKHCFESLQTWPCSGNDYVEHALPDILDLISPRECLTMGMLMQKYKKQACMIGVTQIVKWIRSYRMFPMRHPHTAMTSQHMPTLNQKRLLFQHGAVQPTRSLHLPHPFGYLDRRNAAVRSLPFT